MNVLKEKSKLTSRYQTTIPASIRATLSLKKGDEIEYEVRKTGDVVLRRASHAVPDPALAPFLSLLESDVATHPERLRPVPTALLQRASELTRGMDVDLDAPLDDDER